MKQKGLIACVMFKYLWTMSKNNLLPLTPIHHTTNQPILWVDVNFDVKFGVEENKTKISRVAQQLKSHSRGFLNWIRIKVLKYERITRINKWVIWEMFFSKDFSHSFHLFCLLVGLINHIQFRNFK